MWAINLTRKVYPPGLFDTNGAAVWMVTIIADLREVTIVLNFSMDHDVRALLARFAVALAIAAIGWQPSHAEEGLIDGEAGATTLVHADWTENHGSRPFDLQRLDIDSHVHLASCNCPRCAAPIREDFSWLRSVRVGYDDGFVIASLRPEDLGVSRFPYQLRINGWGQLRHTITSFSPPSQDLNQFALKRGRLVFSGSAFNPNFSYFIQLDGRSSSGDNVRLLDYYLNYDLGNDQLGLDPGTIVLRAGKYKVPFTMSRWLSGRDFEFTDRSVASIFFDVNRSFSVGIFGETKRLAMPINWEFAIFNGLVTGGAETGSSGNLDDNFAYSGRLYAFPIGEWGSSRLADFEWHERLAMRTGFGFAASTINRSGSTEFSRPRVVDSGLQLSSIVPNSVQAYSVSLFAVDASWKYRGWSSTLEYYFRTIDDFSGGSIPDLYDHGFWFQLGKFIVPDKLQLVARWSRVQGNSGTLGNVDQSADEVAGALAWYFRENHAKFVIDLTHINGAPINSSALDIVPGNRGWLCRSQFQFSF